MLIDLPITHLRGSPIITKILIGFFWDVLHRVVKSDQHYIGLISSSDYSFLENNYLSLD